MDLLAVVPSVVVSVYGLIESKDLKFLIVLGLAALWFVPVIRTTYWIALLLVFITYFTVFRLSKGKLSWPFWAGAILLVSSTIFRTYLAVGEPDKPSFWWLLPQKMAQRGSDFANNVDLTRNVSVLLDVTGLSLLVYSTNSLKNIVLRLFSMLASFMFVFFLWYPTFEVRLTPSYLDVILWSIGLIPAVVYLISVFSKSSSVEADFYFFFVVVYSLFFAPPRGGSFELALVAMVSFPWAALGELVSSTTQTLVLSGLPPSIGFLFRGVGLASLLITAPTVPIARIYVLFMLVGLCYDIAKHSGVSGIIPVAVGIVLSFAGILTGLASSIAVNLWGGSGAFFSLQNIFNATVGWANIKLDVIDMLIPFAIALLASYVFFGEGR
jgi:hypothetical protein